MGSDSDLKIMKPAIDILKEFKINTDVCILSAHRTPFEMMDYAKEADLNNIKVIIAGAGGAAHLPGMIASVTNIPVIGVPVESKTLRGMDSLLSIVQMPSGVPVATVAINGGQNAGILAIQICSLFDEIIKQKLLNFRSKLHKSIRDKNEQLNNIGADNYLEEKDL
tara:strand:- start:10156 stop:10653 length:498 start_codon:yes stop_codon:yes gene_type:complete